MTLSTLPAVAARFAELHAAEAYRLERDPAREPAMGTLHREHAWLLSSEAIEELRDAAGAGGDGAVRARRAMERVVEGRAALLAARQVDERIGFLRGGSLRVGDLRVPVSAVVPTFAAADAPTRRRIEEAFHAALGEREASFHDLFARSVDAHESVGRGTPVEAMEEVSGVDLRSLAGEAERLLADTEPVYRDLLDWHLRRARITPQEATPLELEAIGPPEVARREMSARPPLVTVGALLEEAGMDPGAGGRLAVEVLPALGSGDPAACRPLRIPDSVSLLRTRDTQPAAHAAVLRALGEGLHHAHASPDLAAEDRWLGDRSVPFASGVLLGALLERRSYLGDGFRLPAADAEEWLRFAAFRLLLRLRRDAALLQGALEFVGGAPMETMRGQGAERLTDALGARHDPRATLALLELPAAIARRLRAEALGRALLVWLRDRYDEDWYRNPGAGPALRGYFSDAALYSADEQAAALSGAPLTLRPLAAWATQLAG